LKEKLCIEILRRQSKMKKVLLDEPPENGSEDSLMQRENI
jgi:hypothetical protein